MLLIGYFILLISDGFLWRGYHWFDRVVALQWFVFALVLLFCFCGLCVYACVLVYLVWLFIVGCGFC